MPDHNILPIGDTGITLVRNTDGSVTVQLPFPFGSREFDATIVAQIREWFDASSKSSTT